MDFFIAISPLSVDRINIFQSSSTTPPLNQGNHQYLLRYHVVRPSVLDYLFQLYFSARQHIIRVTMKDHAIEDDPSSQLQTELNAVVDRAVQEKTPSPETMYQLTNISSYTTSSSFDRNFEMKGQVDGAGEAPPTARWTTINEYTPRQRHQRTTMISHGEAELTHVANCSGSPGASTPTDTQSECGLDEDVELRHAQFEFVPETVAGSIDDAEYMNRQTTEADRVYYTNAMSTAAEYGWRTHEIGQDVDMEVFDTTVDVVQGMDPKNKNGQDEQDDSKEEDVETSESDNESIEEEESDTEDADDMTNDDEMVESESTSEDVSDNDSYHQNPPHESGESVLQETEALKDQKEDRALHVRAKALVPHQQRPHRYWVAVLHHNVKPKDAKKEKDFLWIKANRVRCRQSRIESQD